MITLLPNTDYPGSQYGAHTLPISAVYEEDSGTPIPERSYTEDGVPVEGSTFSTRFHPETGWTISGEVREDYFYWVNAFEATHPVYGVVKGDFELSIEATSREAFDHFYKNHPPVDWDYADI